MADVDSRIERIEEVLVYSEPANVWVRLYFDRVRFPDGREGRYNRVVESAGRVGVAVLPRRGSEVCLVRQYRYPIGLEQWEIPRGFGDGTNAEEDAERELAEETGLTGRLVDLGVLYPNSGVLGSASRLFLAEVDPGTSVAPSDGEVTEVRWYEWEHVLDMVAGGEIADAFSVAAIARVHLRSRANDQRARNRS